MTLSHSLLNQTFKLYIESYTNTCIHVFGNTLFWWSLLSILLIISNIAPTCQLSLTMFVCFFSLVLETLFPVYNLLPPEGTVLICPFSLFFPQCLPIPGHGFVLDKYKCHCKSGFYHPSRVAVNGFKSKLYVKIVCISVCVLVLKKTCNFRQSIKFLIAEVCIV